MELEFVKKIRAANAGSSGSQRDGYGSLFATGAGDNDGRHRRFRGRSGSISVISSVICRCPENLVGNGTILHVGADILPCEETKTVSSPLLDLFVTARWR